jgi:hypothetical protein
MFVLNYEAQNLAAGYATGIEFKLNGEFVKDKESWISLSFLQTKEKINANELFRQLVIIRAQPTSWLTFQCFFRIICHTTQLIPCT